MWWGLLASNEGGREGLVRNYRKAPLPEHMSWASCPLQVIQARAMFISWVTDGVQRALYEYSTYFVTPNITVGFWEYGSDGTPVTTGVTTFSSLLGRLQLEIKCDLGTIENRAFFAPRFVEFIHTVNSYGSQQFIAMIHQEPKRALRPISKLREERNSEVKLLSWVTP